MPVQIIVPAVVISVVMASVAMRVVPVHDNNKPKPVPELNKQH